MNKDFLSQNVFNEIVWSSEYEDLFILDILFDIVKNRRMSCPGQEYVDAVNILICARNCDVKSSVYFGFSCSFPCLCYCYPGMDHHNDCVNDDAATFVYKIFSGRYHFGAIHKVCHSKY